MNENLKDALKGDTAILADELQQETVYLAGMRSAYETLYCRQESVDLLNRTDNGLFHLLRVVLYREMILSVCKLLDSASQGRFQNATLSQLQERLKKDGHEDASKRLAESLPCLNDKHQPFRNMRRKSIAHSDYDLAVGKVVLPDAERLRLVDLIDGIGKALNSVRDTLGVRPLELSLGVLPVPGESLLQVLRTFMLRLDAEHEAFLSSGDAQAMNQNDSDSDAGIDDEETPEMVA